MGKRAFITSRVFKIFFFFFFFFLRPYLRHMEVPRLEAESELQLSAYTTATATATATPDPSRIWDLCHSLCMPDP